eukprot:jgi/Galph1/2779/GphlegSOOS_G1449.1
MGSSEDNRVFVGGLPWSVNEDDLRETFSKYGEIVDARVVIDRETGRSRGFGFVSYQESSAVDDCIAALDGQASRDFQGRTIRVNKAMSREQRDEFPSNRGRGGRGRYGSGFRSGPYEHRDFDNRRNFDRREGGRHGREHGGGGFRRRNEDFE